MPQEPDNRTGRSQRRRSRGTRNTEGNVPMMMSYLKRLTQGVQSFKNIISYAQPFDRASITVPDSLIRAWLHLLMSLIYSTQSAFAWSEHCEVTRLLLTEGMAEVMDQISNESLINRAAVLPMEVVSLLGLVLLHDSTGAYPDLGASYSEYLDALGNQIATRPSDRSFQHRISLLKQEIGVIQKTVAAQNGVFNSIVQFSSRHQLPAGNLNTDPRSRERMMSMYYNRDITPTGRGPRYMALEKKDPYSDYARRGPREKMYVHRDYYYSGGGVQDDWVLSPGEFYKLSPTYPGGFRELLAGDCLSLLDRRIREFGEFELHANDLKEENLSNFEDTKDRQELAIYAFTIVTVVFLPLSFVAGVFGMNTSDIRDMTQGQWAYWASAIPVTVLVILIGLWWMGELANLFSWLLPRSGSRVTAAYGIAPRNPRNSGLRGSRGRALDVLPPPYEVDAMPSDFRQRPGTYRY
ncbi:hypothetical protein VTK73DRAFT_8719 [Phialemonium thermophilum]|uniref:Uncharacterized protein n=1 Tax=Phialemonium thermophilum TaxID=223376 RepID=A0ABR3XNQ8_9PEZI